MFINIVLNIIGSILIRIFVSSTCVTVHRLQGPVDVSTPVMLLVIAARSKILGIHFQITKEEQMRNSHNSQIKSFSN